MLNLTQEERKVIIFLAGFALFGMGGNFLVKCFTGVRSVSSLEHNLGKINLNTADKETLICVSGIGEKLAGRIVDHRNAQGPFAYLDELKEIKGISESKYSRIKDELFIE